MNVAGPSQNAHITPLPSSTRSKLRSTQILTSLPQLVSELVQNSLDAGAHTIDVSLDPEEWECWVRDDGAGIPRDGLALLAGGTETGRYGTSKAYTPASLNEVTTFGFRGEALASIADLCCLEISSRTRHSSETWSVILKGGQTLYAGPSVRWRRESSGTVVSVRDAFYNLPIRRRSHSSSSRTVELVKKEVEAFALVFPDVCFSVETSKKSKDSVHAKSKARVLTIPKTQSVLAAFRHLYGKALANHVEEINENRDDMRMEGFISLEGAYSKSYQFLYVNKHPLETCDLHRSVDSIFALSSFSKHAYDESGPTPSPRPDARRSPRKTEKKPVYVLNITIPPQRVDNCIEPSKAAVQLQNPASVSNFLSSVVEAVLIRHNFLIPRHDRVIREPTTPSPRKRRKMNIEDGMHASCLDPRLNRCSSQPAIGHAREGSVPWVRSSSLPLARESGVFVGGNDDASDILWTDPATGETFVIDPRTGNSYPQVAPAGPTQDDTSAQPVARSRRSLGTLGRGSARDAPAWMTEALQANEAYQLTEPSIPSVAVPTESATRHACDHGPTQSQARLFDKFTDNERRHFTPWDAPQLARFSREDLRTARVLGQVDRKFVACIMQPSRYLSSGDGVGEPGIAGRVLVLIDQHAADERIRVERFLKDICEGFLSYRGRPASEDTHEGDQDRGGGGVQTRNINPPANVLLTKVEAERIALSQDVREAFARWGVEFASAAVAPEATRAFDRADEAAYVQVVVRAVPEVVADKLLYGDDLRDLVKGYLAKLETDGVEGVLQAAGSQIGPADEGGWQKALRWCPQELVDLINSKACRGAIMFNDTLSMDQCMVLVSRLAETALPFQCAHGRPSLVPLLDTGGAELFDSRPGIDWSKWASVQ
ncbi:hypothetical protein L226DRAFT_529339 [Lentinus tigrinus ALCF2SS1-7]|uniref:MutL C-terminal dimerisation domain-containing protein n=1 Tax=Lentinus tigrinus ALCF2SS1-6 TaxID=1328759 RepID=A0A5C2STH1_9APHY|nr:hypothetical protein L227DRAFT_589898 [Lentinus tigrinus ALCF2SS1-6]RPD80886.1 hypothetical protein L226DRAFT_529339 [Lentinus tigrinus ALCF2SS1-7]